MHFGNKMKSPYLDKSLYFYLMMRIQEGTPIKQYIDEFNKVLLDN
jgi:hypothetical protein